MIPTKTHLLMESFDWNLLNMLHIHLQNLLHHPLNWDFPGMVDIHLNQLLNQMLHWDCIDVEIRPYALVSCSRAVFLYC